MSEGSFYPLESKLTSLFSNESLEIALPVKSGDEIRYNLDVNFKDPKLFYQEEISQNSYNYSNYCFFKDLDSQKEIVNEAGKNVFRYTSLGRPLCDNIFLGSLLSGLGYLIKIDYLNYTQGGMNLCLNDSFSEFCFIDEYLDNSKKSLVKVFPGISGAGYGESNLRMYLGNNSRDFKDKRITDISGIRLTQIPIFWLQDIKLLDEAKLKSVIYKQASRITPFLYIYNGLVPKGSVVGTGQGFDRGWVPLCGLNFCNSLLELVKINNWGGGYLNTSGERLDRIILVLWPQLLLFIGLGFSLIFLITLILYKPKR